MITDPLTDDILAVASPLELTNEVHDFLTGLEEDEHVRARMERAGYTADDHEQGWDLLVLAMPSAGVPEQDPRLTELCRWHRRWSAVAREQLPRRCRVALGLVDVSSRSADCKAA